MSIKLSNYFLLLAVSFLVLSFSAKAQISPPPTITCDKGYELDRVYDFELEPVTVYDYDPIERRNIPRTEWQNVRKLRWKCVPITSENKPTPSRQNSSTNQDSPQARQKTNNADEKYRAEVFRSAISKLKRYSNNVDVKQTPDEYFKSGNSKFARKDYRGAIVDYDRFIRIYEDEFYDEHNNESRGAISPLALKYLRKPHEAYYNRAIAKEMIGDKAGSKSDFQEACKRFYKDSCVKVKKLLR